MCNPAAVCLFPIFSDSLHPLLVPTSQRPIRFLCRSTVSGVMFVVTTSRCEPPILPGVGQTEDWFGWCIHCWRSHSPRGALSPDILAPASHWLTGRVSYRQRRHCVTLGKGGEGSVCLEIEPRHVMIEGRGGTGDTIHK